MLVFCSEIEQGPHKREYHEHVSQIADWYVNTVQTYDKMLKTEMDFRSMSIALNGLDEHFSFTKDLTYTLGAKCSYFDISEGLVKLILSKYSLGPSAQFLHAHEIVRRFHGNSWLECTASAMEFVEIAAKVLRDEGVEYSFNLQILLQDPGGIQE